MIVDGPAIETDSLSKTYSQGLIFKQRHVALQNVSLTVNRGEIFGLLGPNGAGKTTFLKLMLGIIRKTSGQASLLGHPAGSRQGRKLVGYLPELAGAGSFDRLPSTGVFWQSQQRAYPRCPRKTWSVTGNRRLG